MEVCTYVDRKTTRWLMMRFVSIISMTIVPWKCFAFIPVLSWKCLNFLCFHEIRMWYTYNMCSHASVWIYVASTEVFVYSQKSVSYLFIYVLPSEHFDFHGRAISSLPWKWFRLTLFDKQRIVRPESAMEVDNTSFRGSWILLPTSSAYLHGSFIFSFLSSTLLPRKHTLFAWKPPSISSPNMSLPGSGLLLPSKNIAHEGGGLRRKI